MPPKAFNRIEIGTIRWQPNEHHTMFKQAQGCQRGSAFIIGSIVHHQHHSSGWVLLYQLLFQKVNESRTILGSSNCPGYRIFFPVVATKDMLLLFFARLGGRTDRADLHIRQRVSRFIACDPQDLGFTLTSFAIAHDFHRIDQTGLWIEAYNKILDLIFKRHE